MLESRTPELGRECVQVGDYAMHYRVGGLGAAEQRPVVLVHGQVVSSRYLVPLGEELARDFRVLIPDLPGYGKSEKPRGTPSLDFLADSLVAWMDALAIPEAMLFGNSYGCQVTTAVALRHPRRVARLVLQGPTVDAEGRGATTQLRRWLAAGRFERPSLSLVMLLDYLDAGFSRALGTFGEVLRDRIEERLPKIAVPTLVVRGSRDPIVPQRWAEEVTALLPAGQLRVVPGAGHTMCFSHALELARVMRPFLTERLGLLPPQHALERQGPRAE